MKILSEEHETVIIKDRCIRGSGDYRASPFFLKTREEGRVKLVDLGRAENIQDAIRLAKERGYDPTQYIQVESGKRIATPIQELPVAGAPRKPSTMGFTA